MKRVLLMALVVAAGLPGQEAGVDRVTVPFSDPNAPKKLSVSLVHGSITIKAHAAKEAIVAAKGVSRRSKTPPPPGMRRIDNNATGLSVEESGNSMKVSTGVPHEGTEVTIYVPTDTSVKVSTVNGGKIVVDGLTGEVDAHNVNGNITVTNVKGAVVADTVNGKVTVVIDKVTVDKAMSFSTLNGEVDVTLPADVKANLKVKSGHGETFSDFDILTRGSRPVPTEEKSKSGRRRVRFDSALYGTINGGGPELQFSTLNGTIYIRKKK
jgi:DUF4097 and DUF4098 domain-containing protein YvlB